MAQFDHRVDLTDTSFPLLTQEMGRSVLVSSFRDAPTGEKADTPQIYYCHNIMPTDSGIVSVGYEEIIPAPIGGDANTTFDDTRIIFGDAGNRVHLAITTDGNFYALEEGDTVWRKLTAPVGAAGKLVTLGTVNGISYIYIQGVGGYNYDEVTHDFTAALVFAGLAAGVIGMTASYGYLIAYTEFAIAWSSTIDPLDFVPSTVTGAGGGKVAELEGHITFSVPNELGVLVYTSANVVAATYTGNKQYPFKFKSVGNSKGALGLDQVAYEANAADHYAYTKGGLQTVNSRTANSILPETTDFLAGKQFEDFDESTFIFTLTNLPTTMKKKVKLIASRYLIISYGITTFTHALVYDVALEKLGKLKISHVDCFEYLGAQTEISKESIAFLLNDGTIKYLRFSVPSTGRAGVLLLGKYQYKRGRHLILHRVVIENVAASDTFTVKDLVSLDGKNALVNAMVETVGTGYRDYAGRLSGVNHSILIIGQFNLSSMELTFSLGGSR